MIRGDVYVVDAFRVEKFSPTGTFISKWAVAGGFDLWDISLDSANNVYLSFSNQQILRKYTSTGTLITTIGAPGTANGQFGTTIPGPTGTAINPSTGVVYVADTGNKRIQFFGPDSAAPTVVNNDPCNTATDTSVTPCVCATFSEVMSSASINVNTILLKDDGNNAVTGTISFDPSTKIASFTPSAPLQYNKIYTATIKSGASGVKDTAGNPLASDFTWSFTTMTQPASGGVLMPLPVNGVLTVLVTHNLKILMGLR